jgi:hypothetical protein
MTGRWQESATGERSATIGGSMMAKSWTSRWQEESATGVRAATFSGSMMAKSCTNVMVATERWLR